MAVKRESCRRIYLGVRFNESRLKPLLSGRTEPKADRLRRRAIVYIRQPSMGLGYAADALAILHCGELGAATANQAATGF